MDMTQFIGETSAYDKKREVEKRKVKSWMKSVSAFANTNGGTLIFGVDDQDNVVGLSDPKNDAEFVSELIKTRITPLPEIKIQLR